MKENHWRVIAILGGIAAGFFLTSQFTGYSWPAQIYNKGATVGIG